MLQPVPGQTRENALALLELAVKTHDKTMSDQGLVGAAKRGEKLHPQINNSVASMAQVLTKEITPSNLKIAAAIRSVASTVSDRAMQKRMIAAGQIIIADTNKVISASRVLAVDCTNKARNEFLLL